jgi:hypothetical protein
MLDLFRNVDRSWKGNGNGFYLTRDRRWDDMRDGLCWQWEEEMVIDLNSNGGSGASAHTACCAHLASYE